MADIKKVTKKEVFGEMIKIFEEMNRIDLVEFAQHEIGLIEKKASKSGTSKTQEVNLGIMETIKNELARIGRSVTITELQKESEELAEFSNQKLSALLKKLVDAGEVTKIVDKKKSYFSIAD